MANTNYLRFRIGKRDIEVEDIHTVPLAIDYALEDAENFEQKTSSEAFDVTVPATQNNSQTFNTPHNPQVEDLTNGEYFKSHMPCIISANGTEVLIGKAFLKAATHTDRPGSITMNCYGNNADWVIDLKEKTLQDFVNQSLHVLSQAVIEASWNYNGTSESNDYVYAPVRYRQPFANSDTVVQIEHLKPAISPYWILYRGLKSVGYKLQSTFLDSDYFRRKVMPWTWGDFYFFSEKDLAPMRFKALTTQGESHSLTSGNWNEYVSPNILTGGAVTVSPTINWNDDFSGGATGGFDNPQASGLNPPNGSYQFVNGYQLQWTYLFGTQYGTIKVTLGGEVATFITLNNNAQVGSNEVNIFVHWFINGVHDAGRDTLIHGLQHGANTAQESKYTLYSQEFTINPGDVIAAAFFVSASTANSIDSNCNWVVGNPAAQEGKSYFTLINAKRIAGSKVNLSSFDAFKNYNWLDFVRGLVDTFNLSINTDPVNKVVVIEPGHPYYLGTNPASKVDGYYKAERIDWTTKQDLSEVSELELYADAEREFDLKFKEDSNDGGINILTKRNTVSSADAKYLFPDRFKAGNKDLPNRFFSPVAHVRYTAWNGINNVNTQLIAIIPENVSNTSKDEDKDIFQPKLAHYKGIVANAGGWLWQPPGSGVITKNTLPFMFAVNYNPGGESDPVLTYSDQRVGDTNGLNGVVAHGLLRRFYLPRFAIMRNGRLYHTFMKLDMKDVTNWLHRESIIIRGARYYLLSIEKYKPLTEESTKVNLWQYSPVMQVDSESCFPSMNSVLNVNVTLSPFDIKYYPLMLFTTDLPQ